MNRYMKQLNAYTMLLSVYLDSLPQATCIKSYHSHNYRMLIACFRGLLDKRSNTSSSPIRTVSTSYVQEGFSVDFYKVTARSSSPAYLVEVRKKY